MSGLDVTPYLKKPSRDAFGLALLELAAEDERIVAVTADVPESVRMQRFRELYPQRFFNFGIAEQNMMSAAAGLAREDKIPYVSTFAIFAALRAAEQARTDIAYPNLPARICVSHSGISLGQGGPTHHSLEDVAIYRLMPNMTVIVPADALAVALWMRAARDLIGPLYLRLSRAPEPTVYAEETPFRIGKARWLRRGDNLAILACGASVGYSLQAADLLAEKGIQATVVDMASIKPLDREVVIACAKTGAMLTVEEHSIIGGLGSAVAETLAESGNTVRFKRLGIPDVFTLAAPYPDLLATYKLDASGIAFHASALIQ
jgi:transketolase